MPEKNYFKELFDINVNEKTEQKNGLTYLSWSFAWGEVKKLHPDATYTIYENCDGWFYFTDGKTCWVKTGVTINGIQHIEYLPCMDYKNKSIPVENITSVDVNKAIQRSLTKAIGRHGLGLYVYAGEDLPETEKEELIKCDVCGGIIEMKNGVSAEKIIAGTTKSYGKKMCYNCSVKEAKARAKKKSEEVLPEVDSADEKC